MQHGGNIYQFARQIGCLPEQILDFSANINPEQAVEPCQLAAIRLGPYADPDYSELKQKFNVRYSVPDTADIEPFNGASAAIFALLRHLQPKDLVLYTPLYGEYAVIARQLCCKLHCFDRFTALMAMVPENSTVIFVNPSTPDGKLYELKTLLDLWQDANCTIIIDESFLDFCNADSVVTQIKCIDKLYVLKSLSKFFGCAGVRVGFIVAATHLIANLKRFEPAWKLSSFDMQYIQHALVNTTFIERTQKLTSQRRKMLYQILQASGLFTYIYPGQTNFLLATLVNQGNGHQLQTCLASARILIRVCDDFAGLNNNHIRFAVKEEQALKRLAECLATVYL